MALVILTIVCTLPLVLAEDVCPPHEHVTFHWLDYSVLAAMLIVSCLIGTFIAYFGRTQETSADFLLGGSSIGTLPMTMSLAAGYVSLYYIILFRSNFYFKLRVITLYFNRKCGIMIFTIIYI